MPNSAFHWIRVQTFCYATERKELLEETMENLLGETDEYSEDESVGEHGNSSPTSGRRSGDGSSRT